MRLPHVREPMTGRGGTAAGPWYAWFRSLEDLARAGSDGVATAIRAIALALGSPDGSVEGIPEQARSARWLDLRGRPELVDALGDLAGSGLLRLTAGGLRAAPFDFGDLPTTGAGEGDALVFTGGQWAPGAVSGAVPTRIPTGATYTVAADTQALAALPIDVDGALVIDGALVEVN